MEGPYQILMGSVLVGRQHIQAQSPGKLCLCSYWLHACAAASAQVLSDDWLRGSPTSAAGRYLRCSGRQGMLYRGSAMTGIVPLGQLGPEFRFPLTCLGVCIGWKAT